jgi:hypothetical protein
MRVARLNEVPRRAGVENPGAVDRDGNVWPLDKPGIGPSEVDEEFSSEASSGSKALDTSDESASVFLLILSLTIR